MIVFQERYSRKDIQANPDVLYVFGDNEGRFGYGGQAGAARDEPNAIGVATLAAPGRFWSEGDVYRQCRVIDKDIIPLVAHLLRGGVVIWPLDGIGTGLARLSTASPTTFRHMQARLAQLRAIPHNQSWANCWDVSLLQNPDFMTTVLDTYLNAICPMGGLLDAG